MKLTTSASEPKRLPRVTIPSTSRLLLWMANPFSFPKRRELLYLSPLRMILSRQNPNNEVSVEVKDMFKITARVVPITPEESRVHEYGITSDDCFAHLELSIKFYSLSPHVAGVLGQTYAEDYRSPINVGLPMPVMGGEVNYLSSNLFSTDCKVSRFREAGEEEKKKHFSIVDLNFASQPGGSGIVCRR